MQNPSCGRRAGCFVRVATFPNERGWYVSFEHRRRCTDVQRVHCNEAATAILVNTSGCIGEEIQHEEQVNRHNIRVDGRVVSMTSKNTSKSAPKAHDGIWLGLRMKSDELIIGTPNGVIKAKTLPKDQRWCAEEVLNIRGVPSKPVPGVEETTYQSRPTARDALNMGKRSTYQYRSVRSATRAQPLPHRTRPDSEDNVCYQRAHQRNVQNNATQQRMQDENGAE